INHGNGFVTRYAHLDAIYVSPGQQVSRGELIGKMGCTGRCSGPHVHFMIIESGTPRDPMNYL
ncbi:MAG TPA: M23 family metallopeptidase, partial [Candidatus Wirthbacteria bacterium]|nr:M23 family metallopeptidase [Candidatus Wirthbacteria bacterium]